MYGGGQHLTTGEGGSGRAAHDIGTSRRQCQKVGHGDDGRKEMTTIMEFKRGKGIEGWPGAMVDLWRRRFGEGDTTSASVATSVRVWAVKEGGR